MCDSCGCGDPGVVPVVIRERLLSANDHQAGHNREHFEAAGTLAINLMGSPGSGKTESLLIGLSQYFSSLAPRIGWAEFDGKGQIDVYQKSVAAGCVHGNQPAGVVEGGSALEARPQRLEATRILLRLGQWLARRR